MKVPMTLEGSERLREELEHLKSVLRPQIIQAIATAREHGDLRENAEYHAAKEQQGFAEGRIKEIESKLADAQVIDVTKIKHTGKVVFGSTVTLLEVESGARETLQDRRRRRSRPEAEQDLRDVTDCARADRQVRRRHGRGQRAQRRDPNTKSTKSNTSDINGRSAT